MPQSHHNANTPATVVLNNGGLRSLVALALVAAEQPPDSIAILNADDDRPTADIRREHALDQARHFGVTPPPSRALSAIPLTAHRTAPDSPLRPVMPRAKLLTLAIAETMARDAGRLVYPVQAGTGSAGIAEHVARITEQALLVRQLARLEMPEPDTDETASASVSVSVSANASHAPQLPMIDTPLVEFSDRQIIELGNALRVPWELSWSCDIYGAKPCTACAGCKRRRAAFDAAGTIDPVFSHKTPAVLARV